jgi:hypothetical protein
MDWTELYRDELGIDPSDRQALFTAVSKDIAAASGGDTAAKRRVAAYERASRAFDRQVEAEAAEARRMTREAGEPLDVDPWAAEEDPPC